MLYARAAVDEDRKGNPRTCSEYTLVHNVRSTAVDHGRRYQRDTPFLVDLHVREDEKADPLPYNGESEADNVLGITQDTVVKGQKHFMAAVAGVSPLRISPDDHTLRNIKAGEAIGDPTRLGNCIGYALDSARWDPCADSHVVDVHICHSFFRNRLGRGRGANNAFYAGAAASMGRRTRKPRSKSKKAAPIRVTHERTSTAGKFRRK